MLIFLKAVALCFAALFPFLNPLDSAVIFVAMTRNFALDVRQVLALKVGINTFLMLGVVLLAGSWFLRIFGITIPVVRIGGGAVVAFIGWSMLNGPDDDAKATPDSPEKQAEDMAFFPLTMPLTAGPGCIAATLTVGAHMQKPSVKDTLLGLGGALTGIALGALAVFVAYRYAHWMNRVLSKSGRQVVLRLAAFVNLCIGIQMVCDGIAGLPAHAPL